MGGCRCTFRSCTNNTINSPGKHFFHYPFKDNQRCKRWALNADKINFLELPWTQLRNKTVCEDHFMDSCFMNYKKERLVKTAVPTLVVGSDGEKFEYMIDEDKLASIKYQFNDKGTDSKAIDLPEMQQQAKRTINLKMSVTNGTVDEDKECSTFIIGSWDDNDDSNAKNETPEVSANIDLKPMVLNRSCGKRNQRLFAVRNVQEKSSTKRPTDDSHSSADIVVMKQIKKDVPAVMTKTYSKTNSSHSTNSNLVFYQDIDDVEPLIVAAPSPENNVLTDSVTANILEKINHIEERDANKVDKSLYMQMMTEQAKQIDELKKLLTQKFSEQNEVQTQKVASSISSSSSSMTSDVRMVRVEKGPAMTKVQLFNGIRKYLNPSMVALLRMEMFGSSDREYRPDEKQFSKELFNLNPTVYDYMRDEWRFRLPPKSEVETWLKTSDDDETWEVC